MIYCLENDIPLMGFYRGMQMLATVSGATMIQDIPEYFKEKGINYNFEHRNEKIGNNYRDYASHSVQVKKGSKFEEIVNSAEIKNVPSWHHQAVKSTEGTPLEITGIFSVNGEEMIECIERTDKKFAVGFQFHPEAAIVKNINKKKIPQILIPLFRSFIFTLPFRFLYYIYNSNNCFAKVLLNLLIFL